MRVKNPILEKGKLLYPEDFREGPIAPWKTISSSVALLALKVFEIAGLVAVTAYQVMTFQAVPIPSGTLVLATGKFAWDGLKRKTCPSELWLRLRMFIVSIGSPIKKFATAKEGLEVFRKKCLKRCKGRRYVLGVFEKRQAFLQVYLKRLEKEAEKIRKDFLRDVAHLELTDKVTPKSAHQLRETVLKRFSIPEMSFETAETEGAKHFSDELQFLWQQKKYKTATSVFSQETGWRDQESGAFLSLWMPKYLEADILKKKAAREALLEVPSSPEPAWERRIGVLNGLRNLDESQFCDSLEFIQEEISQLETKRDNILRMYQPTNGVDDSKRSIKEIEDELGRRAFEKVAIHKVRIERLDEKISALNPFQKFWFQAEKFSAMKTKVKAGFIGKRLLGISVRVGLVAAAILFAPTFALPLAIAFISLSLTSATLDIGSWAFQKFRCKAKE